MAKIDHRTKTQKQLKLLELLKINIAKTGKRKTLGALVLEAGYSETMSKQPSNIMKSETIKQGMKDYLNSLDDKRKQSLYHITDKKLKQSKARDLAYINDVLTKNHQLLGGGATERVEISDKEKQAVDDAFNLNS